MVKTYIVKIILISYLISSYAFSSDIPVIVISPSKTPQSSSTTGTSVTVVNLSLIHI